MILIEGTSYTFSQVFELPYETEEILAELGYQYQIAPLALVQSASSLPTTVTLLRQKGKNRVSG